MTAGRVRGPLPSRRVRTSARLGSDPGLVGLIGVSVCISLLEAWPISILIDKVLTGEIHGGLGAPVFLVRSCRRPDSVRSSRWSSISAALQVTGFAVWMGRA